MTGSKNKNTIRQKLYLSLIHNNNDERNSHIKPNFIKLKRELMKDFDVSVIENSYQPKINGGNIFLTCIRKIYLWKINREWIIYKNMKPRNIILDLIVLARRLLLTCLNKTQENKRFTIDTFVTNKHIKTWNDFMENNGDILICFEDDAVFLQNTILNIKEVLHEINIYSGKSLYADLAGGCSFDVLKVDNLIKRKDVNKIYFQKPVTNTACCYLIN